MQQGLQKLFGMLTDVPKDWFESNAENQEDSNHVQVRVGIAECTSYSELVEAWDYSYGKNLKEVDRSKLALRMSDSIDISFSAMLATVASTQQQGSQLWLRVIGPPGSAKSTLCMALETNPDFVYGMSKFTGFHSGTRTGDQSNNLIGKIRGKTVVINEGDMLLTSPQKDQILSEIRDIYTGKTAAVYRTGENYEESGIRASFIVAGTSTLRRLNKSSAGDRFLDTVVHERKIKGGEDEGERDLLLAVAESAVNRTKRESGGDAVNQDTPEKVLALQKTAGFIQYLRENAATGIQNVEVTLDVKKKCVNLAQLVAYMRARPDIKSEGEETEAELATRLTEQFIKAAMCLSFAMGVKLRDSKTELAINQEVMRRVANLAKHTCKGPTYTLSEILFKSEKSLDVRGLEARTDYKVDTVRMYKDILSSIGCIKSDNSKSVGGASRKGTGIYRLTPQMTGLFKNLYNLLGLEYRKVDNG